MSGQDLKTQAIVLRRTNYGEADRILNILTPQGKMAVVAKGVRKEKSRLAGGIEMFCLSDVVVHQGKSEFSILTSAKMNKFFKNLLSDYTRMETASEILKRVSRATETVDSPEYFAVLSECFEALNDGADTEVVLTWFYLNLVRISGEQINLYIDTDGEKLAVGSRYSFDTMERALSKNNSGKISTNEIKVLRLMVSAKLALALKVKASDFNLSEVSYVARALAQV